MKEVMVDVKNISMCFNMTTEKITTMKEYLIKLVKGQVFYREFWALKNINFQIYKGEVFGILGLNGAGKSTLLKIIAGVLKPTKGEVRVYGSMAPLIELGAGFDPELTARENIFLNGAVLGYNRKEMEKKFDEIVEFSELQEFIDTPIKNFSSGMYARLGFSIATTVNPDILIVDEILSVGDFKFQEKSENRIKEMINNGTTVIIVSHSIDQIRHMCDRGLILEKGESIIVDEVDKVCDYYYSRYS
ncbi:teichoic acid ABC transporter ATP-binding protein [Caloranaerobacter azorensis H53214]|uniref:Teichoic acid ABC transporter ATP-binding protein n=1 Tax=Caloranaerobacter azorensis H53214 TaxID=1156417 RepID=A0A096CTB9_9FIRM|nr:ABC transporter ATP-binding protein [Caloranaerobacter azorensis]KGG79804.1 teichoic acid ABC transporter ATP-binding protein [Caloranaerobacter azorensis H53214]